MRGAQSDPPWTKKTAAGRAIRQLQYGKWTLTAIITTNKYIHQSENQKIPKMCTEEGTCGVSFIDKEFANYHCMFSLRMCLQVHQQVKFVALFLSIFAGPVPFIEVVYNLAKFPHSITAGNQTGSDDLHHKNNWLSDNEWHLWVPQIQEIYLLQFDSREYRIHISSRKFFVTDLFQPKVAFTGCHQHSMDYYIRITSNWWCEMCIKAETRLQKVTTGYHGQAKLKIKLKFHWKMNRIGAVFCPHDIICSSDRIDERGKRLVTYSKANP